MSGRPGVAKFVIKEVQAGLGHAWGQWHVLIRERVAKGVSLCVRARDFLKTKVCKQHFLDCLVRESHQEPALFTLVWLPACFPFSKILKH